MKEHFLTFILPCHNYAEIIEQSLQSVYQQKNLRCLFEVICTDDSSTDPRTPEILKKWASKYDNFHVFFSNGEPKGECFANNNSISHSQGDIFFCLDTDNVLVSDSVQGLIDHLDKTGCEGACFEELRFFREIDGEYVSESSWFFKAPNNVVDIHRIIREAGETPAASGNYLFTRESYEKAGGYPNGNVMGSWSFGFRQHATGSRIAILPKTFYWHRHSEGGMYLTNQKKGLNYKAVMKTALEFPKIYTPETWRFMQTEECQQNFLRCCNSGKIKLRIR
jgi:glycosyltransferase involved in cell wall biosynthesis